MPNTPPIVIVAYNRPKSLSRLLKSVNNAYYPKTDIELIISIDFSPENQDVTDVANSFEWKYGKKTVKIYNENQGLKKHVLSCGDLALEYNNIIVLEDDLYVSPNFYNFALEALSFSKDKPYIGGVSLYNHKTNVHNSEYFSAFEDGYDNWYFQFASSWGQAWSKEQWEGFKEWFEKNPIVKKSFELPDNVYDWSAKSWLKFYIAYLIDTEKFFLYPKISLSTNFSDKGMHAGSDSTVFQTELLFANKKGYNFSEIKDSYAVYDAYFENKKLAKNIELTHEQVEIDLYGIKKGNSKDYLLSSKRMPCEVLQSFGRSLKPIEANIVEAIEGDDLFLYNLKNKQQSRTPSKKIKGRRIVYSTKYVSYKSAKILFFNSIKDLISYRIRKVINYITK